MNSTDTQRITIQKLVLDKTGKFAGNAIALECGNKTITYGEFDRLTDRICVNLQKNDCGPGCAVIVRIARSAELALAMFGIFKSGAAYVPVAPNVPDKRFEAIQKSVKASMVIDLKSLEQLMEETPQGTADGFSRAELSMAKETDPAMILYTSGSTGEPKGVVQNQGSVGFLFDQFPYKLEETGIKIGEFDSILSRLSPGFAGAYHYEYGAALLNGKKLALLREEDGGSIAETCRILEKGGKFCTTFIASQLKVFLENERFQRALSAVSSLCFLAEPVPDALQDQLKHLEGFSGSLVTLYGQTECYGIGWQDLRQKKGMLPSANVQICTIDEKGKPLEAGERGELAVASPTLFDGYLLSDEKEARRLTDLKYTTIDGRRFMRTGDVGVIYEDGRIQLDGRNDRMVKYHGQRIELPEIEELIKTFPGIRNCCVVIAHSESGSAVLCAYYEGENNDEANLDGLRTWLKEKLPPYMIPACFQKVSQLPMSANGKIDLKYLESLPIDSEKSGETSREKTLRKMTSKEQLIADAAARLLKIAVDDIHPDTNLMVLGVDSLNAVILINDLAEAGYSLSLEDYIYAASVEELSKSLKEKEKTAGGREKKDVSKLVRCTDMQTIWIQNNLQVVSVLVAFRGIEKIEAEKKMQQMEICHPAFRSSFIEDDGKYYTKVLKKRPIRWEYSDLRKIGDDTGEMTERQRRFVMMKYDLLQGQQDTKDLFFVSFVRIAEDKTVLLSRVDHRVVDGMSERILINELLSEKSQEEPDNYVAYIDSTGDPETRENAKVFWKNYLQGTEIPRMPTNPGSTGKSRYACSHIVIQGEKEDKIREFCHTHAVSLSAYILCQYARAIMDVLNVSDTILNVAVSGRSMDVEDMEKVVGCIVNTVPIRIRKTDTEKDFMSSYLMADRYSFLNAEEIYEAAFGRRKIPDLLPFVVSEIFPDAIVKEKYETIRTASYEQFTQGDFLWEDENGIHMMLHPDVDRWDEQAMNQIIERTKERLLNENV